ncbi:hypothetical protein G6F22_021811 [Rhizopus arrhizus]|nr:hypothetical protein G6F22_021811 [Rhizopus arrhizus]
MDALDRQILDQDACEQCDDRDLAEGQQAPGTEQQEQADSGGQVAQAAVGQTAESVGGIGAGRPSQTKQPDGGGAVFIGRAGQQEGQRGPPPA